MPVLKRQYSLVKSIRTVQIILIHLGLSLSRNVIQIRIRSRVRPDFSHQLINEKLLKLNRSRGLSTCSRSNKSKFSLSIQAKHIVFSLKVLRVKDQNKVQIRIFSLERLKSKGRIFCKSIYEKIRPKLKCTQLCEVFTCILLTIFKKTE